MISTDVTARHRRMPRMSPRKKQAGIAALAAAVVVGTGLIVAFRSSPDTAAALSPFAVPGRGATAPFVEQEAEDAATDGTILAQDRRHDTLPAEASGRRAVTLDKAGRYVTFRLTKPANAMSLRYSVRDGAEWDVRVGGSVLPAPATARSGHRYDEARMLLDRPYPAGTQVRIEALSAGVTIDLADFELVADPAGKPAGALDVVADFGADPSGNSDSAAAFQAAVDAGKDRDVPVFVPGGTFMLSGPVAVDQVTLRGAGPWYSVLSGAGVVGRNATDVTIQDLAIIGGPFSAVGGSLSESVIDNVWMQDTQAGVYVDGPADGLTVRNCRILDQTGNGVAFHRGVTDSTVENTVVRNTGADGLAMWAQDLLNSGNTLRHNTVVAPVTGNAIAVYGGRDITVSDNVVADTVANGGGLHVANRLAGVTGPTAVSGTFTLARNTLIRAGSEDHGALWFDGLNQPVSGAELNVTATDIIDSSYAAIQVVEGAVTGLNLGDVTIAGAGTYALQLQAPGAATFTGVKATGVAQPTPIYRCPTVSFVIADGGGNTGWQTAKPACGGRPAPKWRDGWTAPARTAVDPAVVTASPDRTAARALSRPSARKATTATTVAKATKKPAPSVDTTHNVARGRPVTESGHTDVYPGRNVTDGDAFSYWESPRNAFPAAVTVDLGRIATIGRVVLKLPPKADWNSRVQTLSVSGSSNGTGYATLAGSGSHTFDARTGNVVTLRFPAGVVRYLRVTITANAGWPAGQLSEVEAYGG
jgi:F5/8 type C domain/Alpha-1,3-glucanase catalytic domain D1/Pectate lyase superfamily protein